MEKIIRPSGHTDGIGDRANFHFLNEQLPITEMYQM